LTAKLVGDVSLLVYDPVKPMVTDPLGAIVALYGSLAAVTFSPDWVYVAVHMLVIFWSPGNVQVSVHGLSALLPVLVSTICAWKPPAQVLVSE
jgi:hypothetical protein